LDRLSKIKKIKEKRFFVKSAFTRCIKKLFLVKVSFNKAAFKEVFAPNHESDSLLFLVAKIGGALSSY